MTIESRSPDVVIIGAGQAGVETAAALRMAGHDGGITVIGEEAGAPYFRPPLSKAFLAGTAEPAELTLRGTDFYERERIHLRTGVSAATVDTSKRTVVLADGQHIPFGALVLATGSRARLLVDDSLAQASNVLYLRTMNDAAVLRNRLTPGVRIAIIGGGYIGLEIASAAKQAGAEVTVIEAADRVLARVTSEPVSEFFQRLHREEGVEVITGARIGGYGIDVAGDVSAVMLTDGRTIEADFLLVGIGVVPRTELAEQIGIEVDNGIVVDEYLRTSMPGIYAVGDVARYPCPQHGGLRRLESAPNASEHARTVAQNILGTSTPLTALPWFWSDQFGLKLQSVGMSATADTVVSRDLEDPRRLGVFYLRNGRLIAADLVGFVADFAAAKRLIASGIAVDPDLLVRSEVPLKSLLSPAAV
ncbi:NAD(P)/FAD-dependent oxidoreductase [Nocardia sp. NPDC052278]|uniref:NAD(P)/FAD-dependent oxidoreductase n=1 Tax=unclassified Nocardia TaxID=2637762 RepID=UPI0036AA577B